MGQWPTPAGTCPKREQPSVEYERPGNLTCRPPQRAGSFQNASTTPFSRMLRQRPSHVHKQNYCGGSGTGAWSQWRVSCKTTRSAGWVCLESPTSGNQQNKTSRTDGPHRTDETWENSYPVHLRLGQKRQEPKNPMMHKENDHEPLPRSGKGHARHQRQELATPGTERENLETCPTTTLKLMQTLMLPLRMSTTVWESNTTQKT